MDPENNDTTTAPAGVPEAPSAGGSGHPPADGPQEPAADADGEGGQRQTFDRAYVEQLRRSEAGYRLRAKHADALSARLVTAYAAQTGLLADPTDLPYDVALCDDDGVPDRAKVEQAVAMLLDAKPHLASRRPVGDVGQGARPGEPEPVSLAGWLRAGAG